jgi:hypothetical protein
MPDDSGRRFNPILEFYSPLREKFYLGLVLREQQGGIAGGLEYNATLFDAGTVAALDAGYGDLLGAALSDPDGSVAMLGQQIRGRWASR